MIKVFIVARNEAAIIAGAVGSARRSGADEVHVFDGGFGRFGDGPSTDATLLHAHAEGAQIHRAGNFPDRGAKITYAIHGMGANEYDHVFMLDADERTEGSFPPHPVRGQDYNVLMYNTGPNEMPGVRGEWPRGDYSRKPVPRLRMFAWTPNLRCTDSGVYYRQVRIAPYTKTDSGAVVSALPVVQGLRIAHSPELHTEAEIALKRALYEAEAASRLERVKGTQA